MAAATRDGKHAQRTHILPPHRKRAETLAGLPLQICDVGLVRYGLSLAEQFQLHLICDVLYRCEMRKGTPVTTGDEP